MNLNAPNNEIVVLPNLNDTYLGLLFQLPALKALNGQCMT